MAHWLSTYELLVFININPRARVAPGPVTFTFTLSPSCRKKTYCMRKEISRALFYWVSPKWIKGFYTVQPKGEEGPGVKALEKATLWCKLLMIARRVHKMWVESPALGVSVRPQYSPPDGWAHAHSLVGSTSDASRYPRLESEPRRDTHLRRKHESQV